MADPIDCLCQQRPCGMMEVSKAAAWMFRKMGAKVHNGLYDDSGSGASIGGLWVRVCWANVRRVEAELERNLPERT